MNPIDNEKYARRNHSLHPRDVGFVNNDLVGVWANWDHVLVKTSNTTIFEFESFEGLIHDARLVDKNKLLVVFGSGICVDHFGIYDLERNCWGQQFKLSAEVGLVGASEYKPLVAFENGDNVDIWDISCLTKVKELELVHIASFTEHKGIIAAAFNGIYQFDNEQNKCLITEYDGPEISALYFSEDMLLFGDCVGKINQLCLDTGKINNIFKSDDEIEEISSTPFPDVISIREYNKSYFLEVKTGKTLYPENCFKTIFLDSSEIAVLGMNEVRVIIYPDLDILD